MKCGREPFEQPPIFDAGAPTMKKHTQICACYETNFEMEGRRTLSDKIVDFDVETTGLQPYSGKNEAFLWIFYDGERAEAIPFLPSEWAKYNETHGASGSALTELDDWYNIYEAHQRIQQWFDKAAEWGAIRAHNSKFDRAFAEQAGCFDVPGDGCWHDSMVVAQAIDERRSVALKAVASQLFGEEAADPQKLLKNWLNAENARRAKLLTDAEKAVVGKLRVKFTESKCPECKTVYQDAHPDGQLTCMTCGFDEPLSIKNRTRPATPEECEAAIAEAKEMTDAEGTYARANYSDVPYDIMEPYALEDVILTRRISDVYDGVLSNKPDLVQTVEFERKAMDALHAVERRGLPTRASEYRKLEQEVIDNLSVLEDRVHELAREGDPVVYAKEIAGKKEWGPGKQWVVQDETGKITSWEGGAATLDSFNPNSTAQIIAAFKARGADLSYMSEKNGSLSADADNLRAVDDELALAILEFRSEYKVLSTYVRPMIGRSYVSGMNVYKEPFIAPDGRIHATYRQVGARTGRMSCADPNMQNQPRDDLRLRYNIVADPGCALITCDLTNIEMVLFAAYCGEGRLLDAVRRGDDLHVLTAKMLGFRDRKRAGGGYESARQQGKVFNFTKIYGGGLRSIKRYFRCDMNQARLYQKRYAEAYPEVGLLAARIERRLETDGYIQDKLISGRRFRVDMKDSYKAVNYLVQGTAAALLKDAMIKLHADGVPMVALVHDEILAHVRQDEAQDIADLIEQRMVQAAQPGGQLWLPERERETKIPLVVDGEPVLDHEHRPVMETRKVIVPAQAVVPLRAEAEIVERWSDAKKLKDDDGREYMFTPQWAGGEKRYLKAA